MGDMKAVAAEISRAATAGELISDGCARTIAAMYHSDNTGVSFSTTGAIVAEPDRVWHALFGGLAFESAADRSMADALMAYLSHHGERGPVDGWSRVWVDR